MRVRDIIKFGKNIVAGLTIEISPAGFPSITFRGEALWNIYENPIAVSSLVSDCFIGRRILWENFKHEFRFLEQSRHREVTLASLQRLIAHLDSSKEQIKTHSYEDQWLKQIIDLLRSQASLTQREITETPSWIDYNKWNDEIDPLGEDERMTPEEETKNILDIIKEFRRKSYPIWGLLIDFMNDGPLKEDAKQKLQHGRESVGLDSSEVDQSIEIVPQ